MAKKQTNAIFFDDLKESAQARLIGDAMRDIFPDAYLAVRSVRISPDLYGYDPDPAKQTVEQHIVAKIVINRDRLGQEWYMVWNCMSHEFTTCLKNAIETIDDLTAEEKEERNRIQMEIIECDGEKMRACKHLGYDPDEFVHLLVKYNL